jgi:ATP-binding cassette subfamily C protein LapB
MSEKNKEDILSCVERPWKRLDIITASLGLNILSLLTPIFILQLYDRVIPHQGTSTLLFLSLGMAVAVIIEVVLRFSRSQILIWLGERFQQKTTTSAFDKISHAPAKDVKKEAGTHMENMESPNILRDFLAGNGFLALLDLPFLLLFFVIMAFFAGKLVVVPLVVIGLFTLSLFFLTKKLQTQLDKRNDVDERRYNLIIEILSHYHTLKALGLESAMMRRFERLHEKSSLIEYKVNLYSNEARDLGTIFSYILFGSVATVGALFVIEHYITPGIMGACVILSNRLMQPVQSALGVWTRFHHFRLAKDRFDQMKNLPTVTSANEDHIQGDIKLKNVSHHFGDRGVLKDVSIHIPKNTITSIYGENGSGKTTLLRIIAGQLSPDSGVVLLDGEPLNYQQSYRELAYLSAENVLLEGTLLENMTLFQSDRFKDEALHYTQQLGLMAWMQQLPAGMDTPVGNSLVQSLPSGILQRVSLVQAFVLKPRILILDEANTSLDVKSDEVFKNMLLEKKKEMTIIVATHRPSIQHISDYVFTITGGKLYPSLHRSKRLENDDVSFAQRSHA